MLNLRIDKVSYIAKPNSYEIAKISNKLSETEAKMIDFTEFCSLVGEQGCSFCVSDFYGKRTKENFKSQQIFALDFDCGITYSEISMRAESYGLPIALAYETFSSENENRFRIVFVNAFEVTDIRVSEIIIDALIQIFPECDKSCRDVSRIFFGGKRIIYLSEKYMFLSNLKELKNINASKKEIEILTQEEQKALISVCDYSPYGMGIITALNMGMRLGELLGIMWSDINFDRKTISISKQVNRLHDYSVGAKSKTRLGIQDDTKTTTSTRVISINDKLLEQLLNYKEIQNEHIKKWGKAYKNLDMVFAREDGFYIDPSTFRDKYLKILNQAKLKHYTFHALRHTFATRALEAGIPIKVVSKILGHAGVQITMDTYMHVLPELQNEAMNRIAEYMSNI